MADTRPGHRHPLEALARRRVPLGFLTAVVALIFADPTWGSWRAGLIVALAGEAIRIWAAGHLEKSREVTRSGPYRWMRHPLYVGSSLLAVGVIIAARHLLVAVVAVIYMVTTLTAAVRTEEAFLRRTFGDTYDRYRASAAEPMMRAFSVARVLRNKEYRAVIGMAIGFALLAAKVLL
ncbi:MAG TPA: isoprenylcysteine carboxylmethyltransferase family protein [Planctomycetaceae bacterium]|nr:isoprenylcysteine carboxylmethyltransferase family protein [Planctomycetaceae bacterium]